MLKVVSGNITSEPITSVSPETLSGVCVHGYGHYLFNRIHVLPGELNLGSITQESIRSVVVWNACFDSKTMTGVQGAGLDGIYVSHAQGLTGMFPPMSSRVYDVTVGLDGPADIDSSLVFDFGGVLGSVRMFGKRLILWGFEPNWEDSPVEIYEYLTDTFISYDNTEQRTALRDEPRLSARYQFMVKAKEARSLRGLQYALQAGKVTLPNWISNTQIAAPLQGNNQIFCDTEALEIESGESIVILKDSSLYDVKTVSAVNEDHLVLTDPIEVDFGDSTVRVSKTQSWLMQDRVSVNAYNDDFSTLRPTLSFDISDKQKPLVGISEPVVVQYKSLPVFDFAGNRLENFNYDWERKVKYLDNSTGLRQKFDQSKTPGIDLKMRFDLQPRSEINRFKGFMNMVQGTALPFWCETYNQDMILESTTSIGSFNITIQDIGYKGFYFKDLESRDIAITLFDGTKFYREIQSVTAPGDGTETLTLNEGFPIDLESDQIERISFLKYSRFKSDKFEFKFLNDNHAVITKIIKGLRYDI